MILSAWHYIMSSTTCRLHSCTMTLLPGICIWSRHSADTSLEYHWNQLKGAADRPGPSGSCLMALAFKHTNTVLPRSFGPYTLLFWENMYSTTKWLSLAATPYWRELRQQKADTFENHDNTKFCKCFVWYWLRRRKDKIVIAAVPCQL